MILIIVMPEHFTLLDVKKDLSKDYFKQETYLYDSNAYTEKDTDLDTLKRMKRKIMELDITLREFKK